MKDKLLLIHHSAFILLHFFILSILSILLDSRFGFSHPGHIQYAYC
jgi:hypothetical protein